MGGQHHAAIGIADGISEDRLVRRAHAVHRLPDGLEMHLPAAQETCEVEHDRIDPRVRRRRLQRMDDVARGIFADRRLPADQQRERIDGGAFFHDHAIEIDQQRAFAHLRGAGACRQRPEQQGEEQQQEQQAQAVLDPNE